MNNEREESTDPIRRKGYKVVPCTHKLIKWNIAQTRRDGMGWDGMVAREGFVFLHAWTLDRQTTW